MWKSLAGNLSHKFVKNWAIDKYFGTHVKSYAIVTCKKTNLLHKIIFIVYMSQSI